MKGILCFGDSITFGRGEKPNFGWVGRLKRDFEKLSNWHVVYNLGIPGDTSSNLLNRFENEIKTRVKYLREGDQFVIVVGIGTNDTPGDSPKNSNISIKKFKKHITKLITISKKYSSNVLFLGLSPVDENLTLPWEGFYYTNGKQKKFEEVIKTCCLDKKALFLPLFDTMIKKNYQELLKDGLHPNSKGYDFMFNIIKTFLEKNKLI
ncbi:hypothetical protein HOC32_03105 [Candidatus Woesearchaeota archaeon]|nr:hypothetical protein [Candidatus Woesearchaeota archaeon]